MTVRGRSFSSASLKFLLCHHGFLKICNSVILGMIILLLGIFWGCSGADYIPAGRQIADPSDPYDTLLQQKEDLEEELLFGTGTGTNGGTTTIVSTGTGTGSGTGIKTVPIVKWIDSQPFTSLGPQITRDDYERIMAEVKKHPDKGVITAVCNDGWLSDAVNRQGQCSHHGGIFE